jgi:lipoate-protein ligase A
MQFHVLPNRLGNAAENMALDFLLLQQYPDRENARFRHYGWHRPSFTYGYSQKIAWVRERLPKGGPWDICRRPTGGGVVDHRDDWTFALVIPRGHPLEELRAVESYRAVHEALAAALAEQGVPAVLKQPSAGEIAHVPGLCFTQPEVYDVMHSGSGEKIAGAAQKRNKHGLLFQGSIWRPSVRAAMDWERFGDAFVSNLASTLTLPAVETPWPDLNEEEVTGLTEQYGSQEWVEYR